MKQTSWQRLIRFISHEDGGQILYGEPVGDLSLDVGLAALDQGGGGLEAKVIEGDPLFGGVVTDRLVTVKQLLSPLPPERIGAARCLGSNYSTLGKKPDIPILFLKPQTSLSHPNAPIRVPRSRQDETDFENELVIVIGKTCKDVSVDQALDYVLGYTLCNDVTARNTMRQGKQWGMGKNLDTWLPIGPCIVSASVLTDPQAVRIQTHVNGSKMQDESTSRMLYTVKETVAHLSIGSTLLPGSIICTGSPDGFGARSDPPKFLQHGDEVRCSADHGIGTLSNRIEFEGQAGLKSKL